MTDVQAGKAQIFKTVWSVGFLGRMLGNMMGNFGQKALIDLVLPLAKYVLPDLTTKETSSILYKLERKLVEKGL